ncbi:hypothetical protein GX51_03719 [Blastomyces parvus]|uniref:Uncharacterized protein n=1 Tax=Blastomyces parvus TaxID=2060905 RepID=A0A2B7X584_9EURO|nr:hypothetical protein GX51_03719 [Blastomyces parvus]
MRAASHSTLSSRNRNIWGRLDAACTHDAVAVEPEAEIQEETSNDKELDECWALVSTAPD